MEIQRVQPATMGTIEQFLEKVNTESPYHSAVPLLDIQPKGLKIGIQTDTCMLMFISAFFTIDKR